MRIGNGFRGEWLVSGADSDCATKSTIFVSSTDFFVPLRVLVFVADDSLGGASVVGDFRLDTRLPGIVSFSWHFGQETCRLACLEEALMEWLQCGQGNVIGISGRGWFLSSKIHGQC